MVDPGVSDGSLLPHAQALVQVCETLLVGDAQEHTLSEVSRLLAAGLSADVVELLQRQPELQALLVRAGFGPGAAARSDLPSGSHVLAKQALATGGVVCGADPDAAGYALPDGEADRGFASSAAVAVQTARARAPWGVLQAHRRAPQAFSADERALLQAAAHLFAAAIERDRSDRRARVEEGRLRNALEASEAECARRDEELAAANARLQDAAEHRRQLEEILRQSHKMEAIGKLTGGVAHDFNNLLQGICGSLELMRVRAAQGRTGELGNYIETALASANRAAMLANRLLTFSQRRPFEPCPCRIDQVVSGMEDVFRRTVGPMIRIETRNGPELWPSMCDPNQIESALLDLVINARDAIEDGGTILIETANVFASPGGAHEDVPPGEYVVLSVTDTGTGMTPAVMAQAFDPFFSTKPSGQGAGLGLALVQGLLQQSGGHIRLQSEVGEGTRAAIYLPRYLGLLAEDETGAAPSQPKLASSVLVVDDEPAARMFVTDVLSDAGYTVIEAHDSRSGLHALESEARIDLLLTDVGLPGGMNGRQLADAARQRRPGLKVLFVTGYDENAAIDDNLLEEGVLVMTKPFGMAALKATVEGIIGR